MNYILHDFYCLNCGNKGISLARKDNRLRNKNHRKRLYCIYCKTEVNHIECRNSYDVAKFKKAFEEGKYKQEAEESLTYVRENK